MIIPISEAFVGLILLSDFFLLALTYGPFFSSTFGDFLLLPDPWSFIWGNLLRPERKLSSLYSFIAGRSLRSTTSSEPSDTKFSA